VGNNLEKSHYVWVIDFLKIVQLQGFQRHARRKSFISKFKRAESLLVFLSKKKVLQQVEPTGLAE